MDSQTANWDHCLEYAALSDVGLRRANNQDSMAVVLAGSQDNWRSRGHLFGVADGMGAHAAGELASKLATDTIALTYPKLLEKSPPEAILTAVQSANAQIHSRGQANLDFKGMGTTCTTLLLLPQGALLAHAGDSRAYRLRGERLEQMTFDHSLVWEMRAAGQISDDQVLDNIPKNVITRSLGPNARVKVDLEGSFPIELGDTFLLCSDGLSGQVADEEIGIILGCLPPAEAVQVLVDLANLRGGPDNITVIVVKVTGNQVAHSHGSQADTASGPVNTQPVNPLLWTLLGVSALAALGAAVMEYWIPMLVCLAVSVVLGVVALVQRYGTPEPAVQFGGQSLGKGPYAACNCSADREFVDQATEIVDQLRDTAVKEGWKMDWNRLDSLLDRAGVAEQAGDYRRAVGESFRAISFMMAQLKHQHDG